MSITNFIKYVVLNIDNMAGIYSLENLLTDFPQFVKFKFIYDAYAYV